MNSVTNILVEWRDRVAGGNAKQVLQKLRVYGMVKRIYWFTFMIIKPNIMTQNIEGVEIEMKIDEVREYKTVRDLTNEGEIIRDMMSNIDPDDVIYDVGAHIGMYTCILAKKLDDGKLIGFEPHPQNFGKLHENIRLNELEDVATANQIALSDRTGEIQFVAGSNKAGATNGFVVGDETPTEVIRKRESINVEMMSTDSFVKQKNPVPDVVKIDVEGAELRVLEGMRKVIKTVKPRHIYLSLHYPHIGNYGDSVEDVEDFLTDNDYSWTKIQQGDNGHIIRAYPNTGNT